MSDGSKLYEASGAMLLTWEVEALARWCQRVAEGQYDLIPQSGIELTPEFEVVRLSDGQPRVSVSLSGRQMWMTTKLVSNST